MYVVESMIIRAEMEFLLFLVRDFPEITGEIKKSFEHMLRNERFIEEE